MQTSRPTGAPPAWSTPVRALSSDDANASAERLNANLTNGWRPNDHEEHSWNDKLLETSIILNGLVNTIRTGSDSVLGCFFQGEPVGLAVLKRPLASAPGHVVVSDIVAHPGATGVGGMLLEQAVATSMTWGFGGRLRALPLSREAEGAYQALGFVEKDGAMVLSPATSEKWFNDKGSWRLRKYSGKPAPDESFGMGQK